jgi:hypothetical protein
MLRLAHLTIAVVVAVVLSCTARLDAATATFFDDTQVAIPAGAGTTWDRIRSHGYQFTYTRDKLFTGGGGVPIGRDVRVPWPEGIEAQSVIAGPNPGKAKITIERVDGAVFDFTAFSAKLLANTFGAGGSFEVVPFLNGEEQLPDPVAFDATGFGGQVFSYNTTLVDYDKYTIDLYVDFALIGLTFTGAPTTATNGDYNNDGVVDTADYVAWLKTDGSSSDFATWQERFAETGGPAAATTPTTIPEPAALAMLALLLVAVASLRSRI